MYDKNLRELLNQNDSERLITEHFNLSVTTTYDPNFAQKEEAYADGLTNQQALYTSFQDFYQVYIDIKSRGISSFVDLGAGLSKSKFLFDALSNLDNYTLKSTTIEFVSSRVQMAKESYEKYFHRSPDNIYERDLCNDPIMSAQSYFIYLPTGEALTNVISFFKDLIEQEVFLYVIESHGDLINYLESHLFVEKLTTYKLFSTRHHDQLNVYRYHCPQSKNKAQKNELKTIFKTLQKPNTSLQLHTDKTNFWTLHHNFFQSNDWQIIVKQDQYFWSADLLQSRFGIEPNTLEVKSPPRIIKLSQIVALINPSKSLFSFIQQRRISEKQQIKIRKITIYPKKLIEYSNGHYEEVDFEDPLDDSFFGSL